MKVSVIIPTYNRAKMLCECIRSVLASAFQDLEVIVAEDCSPDDTAGEVRRQFGDEPRVRHTCTAHNSFSAGARNQGARVAQGEYLFFLDDDNILEPDCIEKLLEVFERFPNAAFVAPLTIGGRSGDTRPVWTLGFHFNPWTSRFVEHYAVRRLNLLPEPANEDERYGWRTQASPNAFMVRKADFFAVNGLDEGYGMVFEEIDFCFRLLQGERTGWIARNARTNHLSYVCAGQVQRLREMSLDPSRRGYVFGRNRLKFVRRHGRWYHALAVSLFFAPFTVAYYGALCLRYRRLDCACAYLSGTIAGILGIYRTGGVR